MSPRRLDCFSLTLCHGLTGHWIESYVVVAVMFVVPKMMEGMDPEQLKELQAQGGLASMLNPDLAKQEAKPLTGKAKRDHAREERRGS